MSNEQSLGRQAAGSIGLFLIGLACHTSEVPGIKKGVARMGLQRFAELALTLFDQRLDADTVLCAVLDTIQMGQTIEGDTCDRIGCCAADAVSQAAALAVSWGSA